MSKAKDIMQEWKTRKPALLTRREVIELWKKQKDEMLDTYTCPNCRDLMYEITDAYYCRNAECGNYGRPYYKEKKMKKEQKRTSEEIEDQDKPAITPGNQEKVKRQG